MGLVIRDRRGRVLLRRRQNAWAPPSGHVEGGETLREAATRELREGTGFRLSFGAPVAVCDDPTCQTLNTDRGRPVHYVTILFTETVRHREISPGAEASEWGWFAPEALPEHRLAYTDHWIGRVASGKTGRAIPLIESAGSGDRTPHGRPTLGVLCVIWREGKVLLARRSNEPQAGEWGFAGGHVEPGETLAEAAAREAHEETGVRATFTNISALVELLVAPGHHFLLIALTGRHDRGVAAPASDVAEVAWFDPAALPSPLSENVARVIQLTSTGSGSP